MFATLHYAAHEQVIGFQDESVAVPQRGTIRVCDPRKPSGSADAGEFSVTYVDRRRAVLEGESLASLLRDLNAELAQVHDSLYDGNAPGCRENVASLWALPPEPGGLLVIQFLSLYPEYRGRGLGLAALWQLLRTRSQGAGLVAIQACPLQFGRIREDEEGRSWAQRMGFDRFSSVSRGQAREKLVRHYGKLGFLPCGTDGLLVRNAREPIPLPEAVRPWVTLCSAAA